MDKNPQALILLAYKNKALLMSKIYNAIDNTEHEWSLLFGTRTKGENIEESITNAVRREANINIQEVQKISEDCFYARLTDENVNNIKRSEFQLLNFFSLNDVEKLPLTTSTKQFIQKYGDLI